MNGRILIALALFICAVYVVNSLSWAALAEQDSGSGWRVGFGQKEIYYPESDVTSLYIAGYHNDIDSGSVAFVDGFLYAGLGRIYHSGQADKNHILLLRSIISLPICQRQHSEGIGTHLLCRLCYMNHIAIGYIPDAAAIQYSIASYDDRFNRAFGI